MTLPLVTIGITAFNSADTIERAVHSALAQTWRPIEVVEGEEASTDSSKTIHDRLAGDYPELRVFGNAINGGVAVSRNHVLAEARGEFVAFFDDDDESVPERITAQVMRIVEYEKACADGASVICHAARRLVYGVGQSRVAPTMGQNERGPAPSGPAVARRILVGEPLEGGYGGCPTASQMARPSTYRMVVGFEPTRRRSEDTDFNIRLAEAGGHFVGIGRPLVVQTMTRSSEKSLAEEYRNLVLLMRKHRNIMDQKGQYAFCCSWIDMKQAWLEKRHLTFLRRLVMLAVRHPFLTGRRLMAALPNIGLNRDFSRFYLRHGSIL